MNILNAFIVAMTISFASQFLSPVDNGPVAIIPFEMIGSHITVLASINGSEQLPFTFDTGGGTGLVDRSIADRIGMKETSKVPVMGASGTVEYSLSSNNIIELGSLTFNNSTMVMTDLSHMKEFGQSKAGVLGYHQIVGYVVKIDYDSKQLFFYDKEQYEYSGTGSIVPIGLEMRIPSLDAEVQLVDGTKVKGRFLLDTGAALNGSMNSPSVDEYGAINSLEKSYQVEAAGATGTFMMTHGRVKSFSIAGHTFSNSPFMFSEAQQGATADSNYIGLMGNELASRFNIILDYSRNQMILEPNMGYRTKYKVNASGMTLKSNENGQLEINQVFAGGPAEQLGLKEGDVLISVNGQKYKGSERNTVRDILKENGTKVTISWQRKGDLLKGEMTLQDLI